MMVLFRGWSVARSVGGCALFALLLAVGLPAYAAGDLISRGIAEYQDESFEEAVETLEKARSKSPDNAQLLYYLGLSYKSMLDFAKARNYLQQAQANDTDNAEINFHLGEVLYSQQKYAAAEKALKKALKGKVYSGRSSYFLGLSYFKTGRYADAVAAFARAVELDGKLKKKGLYSMGLAQSRMGDAQAALASYRNVIAEAPDSYEAAQAMQAIKAEEERQSGQLQLDISISTEIDTNVVLKPSSQVSGILVTRSRDSSTSLSMGASYSRQVTADAGYSINYGYYQNLHNKLTFFDVQSHHVDATPYMQIGKGTAFMRLSGDYISVDYRRYMGSFGALSGYIMEYGGHQEGLLQAGYLRKIFFQPVSTDGENRNANNYHVGYTHSWLFPQSLSGLKQLLGSEGSRIDLSYALDVESTRGANWDYTGHHYKAAMTRALQNELTLSLSLDHYRQDYMNIHRSFAIGRKDRISTFSPSLEWKPPIGGTVRLGGAITRAKSNISVFDYHRSTYSLSYSGSF